MIVGGGRRLTSMMMMLMGGGGGRAVVTAAAATQQKLPRMPLAACSRRAASTTSKGGENSGEGSEPAVFKWGVEMAEQYEKALGPVIFEPFSAETAKRLRGKLPDDGSGQLKLLELACGSGRVTNHLISLFPQASILATDLSEGMLTVAQRVTAERHGSSHNALFDVADVSNLQYADNSFDAVAFQFGLMFPEDKEKAIREVHRVLKPGGTLVLVTWDDFVQNRLIYEVKEYMDSLGPVIGVDLETDCFKIPFSLSDVDALLSLLSLPSDPTATQRATVASPLFTNLTIEHKTLVARSDRPEEYAHGLLFGSPMGQVIVDGLNNDEQRVQGVVDKMVAFLHKKFGNPIQSNLTAIYSIGTKA